MTQPQSPRSRIAAQRRKGIGCDGWEALLDGMVIAGATFNNRKDALAFAARVLAYYEEDTEEKNK